LNLLNILNILNTSPKNKFPTTFPFHEPMGLSRKVGV